MTNSTVTTKISAVFLATVLLAGTIAVSSPSFIVGAAQATSDHDKNYNDNDDNKKSYGKDRDDKSRDHEKYDDNKKSYGKDRDDKSRDHEKYDDNKKSYGKDRDDKSRDHEKYDDNKKS